MMYWWHVQNNSDKYASACLKIGCGVCSVLCVCLKVFRCIICACQIHLCSWGFTWHQGPVLHRDSVSCLLYRESEHHWEAGADCQQHSLPHFITLTLCCCAPPLRWTHSSLCPSRDQCLVLTTGRQGGWQWRLSTDQAMQWDCFLPLICA